MRYQSFLVVCVFMGWGSRNMENDFRVSCMEKSYGDTSLDINMLDAAYGLDPMESPSMIVMINHME